MDLSHDDVLKILKILDQFESSEIRLEIGDLKLYASRGGESQAIPDELVSRAAPPVSEHAAVPESPAPPAASPKATVAPSPAVPALDAVPEELIAIRAPMLGMFYRAPSPGAEPFVNVGDLVGPDDTVCLIEVMKLFTSVKAGVASRVVEFLVENGAMVEYTQPMILVDPRDQPS